MEHVLGGILAVLMGIVCAGILWREIKTTSEWVTPTTILLALALLDVYLSAARFLLFGGLTLPVWMAPLGSWDLIRGMLWFTVGTAALIVGIRWARGRYSAKDPGDHLRELEHARPQVVRIYVLLGLSLGIYFVALEQRIGQSGGLSAFINAQALSRYSSTAINTNTTNVGSLAAIYINSAALFMILMLVGMLFFFRIQCGHRILWGYVFPFVAWVCCLATFFRGEQVILFLGLLGVETVRIRVAQPGAAKSVPTDSERRDRRHRVTRRITVMVLVTVIGFLGYGGLRTVLNGSATHSIVSPESAIGQQIGDLTSGAALIGSSEIVSTFHAPGGQSPSYLGAGPIVDALLVPLPHAVWTSKPKISGFLEIANILDWPASTQSAVSWAGEAYASFGPPGMLYLLIMGLLIGVFCRFRFRRRIFFVYMFGLMPAIVVSHWMATLGFMNELLYVPLLYLAAAYTMTSDVATPPTNIYASAFSKDLDRSREEQFLRER